MNQKTVVIFKKDPQNHDEVIAFMPYEICDWQGYYTCYVHVGQHSTTCDQYFKQCRTATQEEYKPLLNELISIGYNVEIKKRLNTEKFKQAYQEFLKLNKYCMRG